MKMFVAAICLLVSVTVLAFWYSWAISDKVDAVTQQLPPIYKAAENEKWEEAITHYDKAWKKWKDCRLLGSCFIRQEELDTVEQHLNDLRAQLATKDIKRLLTQYYLLEHSLKRLTELNELSIENIF